MSNHASESRSSGSNSNRRGGQRRRSNNRGGNRSGNRGGRGGNRGGNRSGQGRRNSGQRRREPKPAPLTFWQKILKAIGLYNPDKPTKRNVPSRVPKPPGQENNRDNNRERRPRRERNEPVTVETNRLYVGNLSYDSTEIDLQETFSGAGTVESVEIVYNRNTHRSKGYAFITMASIEDAKRAVETLHDQTFMDRHLIVSPAKSKGPADADGNLPGDPNHNPGPDSEEAA